MTLANWIASVLGFIMAVVGALGIAWPVSMRTNDEISLSSATFVGLNPTLRGMLGKERLFARWGVVLVVVGSSLQLMATWLPG